MGPRSENRGYSSFSGERQDRIHLASMGPRSENRGYSVFDHGLVSYLTRLQWVHGPRTVVILRQRPRVEDRKRLQWVHGPRTVVIGRRSARPGVSRAASMGPRSENRGYCQGGRGQDRQQHASMGPRSENRGYYHPPLPGARWWASLQWVHGPRTVVIHIALEREGVRPVGFNGSTVREPWLFRPVQSPFCTGLQLQWVHGPRTVVIRTSRPSASEPPKALQWVHGPRTVVIRARPAILPPPDAASMGPRSENRGYSIHPRCVGLDSIASMGPRSENRGYCGQCGESCGSRRASMGPRSENRGYYPPRTVPPDRDRCFNGSTVREPWLFHQHPQPLFGGCGASNGSTVREPWLLPAMAVRGALLSSLQWVHGPRTVVIRPPTW